MNLPKSSKKSEGLKEEEFNPFPDLPKKKTSKKSKKSGYWIIPIIILLFIGFLVLGVFIYSKYYSPNFTFFNKTKQVSELPQHPSERALINEFNHDPIDTKPQPYKVVIDPIDPKPGETVKLSIHMNNSTPLISAAAMLETDNESIEKPLTLSNGNTRAGVWTTDWKVSDSYNNTFHFILFLTDDTETYEGVISIK